MTFSVQEFFKFYIHEFHSGALIVLQIFIFILAFRHQIAQPKSFGVG